MRLSKTLNTAKRLTVPAAGHLPHDLVSAIKTIYEPAGMKVTNAALREAESAEYGACRLGLDSYNIAFRVAKTTPTKIGQFVTLWKRPTPHDEIAPLDISDNVNFVVVSVSDEAHCGQFIFDQTLLVAKGIMSQSGKGGKRAIRVYPPWTKPVAKDAIRTQQWQLQCFLSLEQDGTAQLTQVHELFKRNKNPELQSNILRSSPKEKQASQNQQPNFSSSNSLALDEKKLAVSDKQESYVKKDNMGWGKVSHTKNTFVLFEHDTDETKVATKRRREDKKKMTKVEHSNNNDDPRVKRLRK
ncbi:MAG: hypothetical protein K0S11_329 [Gammaproteobacteria bacterium]|nr:hypothetical protein [Gammaproteobacteria bacterium]